MSDGTTSATYSYLDNFSLVGQIVLIQNGTTCMTTSRTYDNPNRLTSVSSINYQQSTINSSAYGYNQANQRTRATLADGSYWRYTFDPLGQVTSAKRSWQDDTPVAGQEYNYAFDEIGNRTSTRVGGDANYPGLRPATTYSPNRLNQYEQRQVSSRLEVLGVANPTAPVTVNGATADRQGEYYDYPLYLNNLGSGPSNVTVAVKSCYPDAQSGPTTQGSVFVPKNPELFSYDEDGNLAQDGRWSYSWDAENRLVSLMARTAAGPQQLIRFEYDWQGRRVHKQVWNNTSGDGSPALELKYIYDGWNLLAALNPELSALNTFLWGTDLSGSPQGAGGVGGLLEVTYTGAQTTNCFVAFDGNGNVTGLIDGADGSLVATYEYGPFGELLRATGPMARANPFRFSTKYQDDETDLLYYGYRYYNAATGRWVSKDPLGERGGKNLYCFTDNNQINSIDGFGNQTLSAHEGDVIYKRAISKTQVNYPKDGPGCACRGRNIGTVFLDVWLDADRNSSIEEHFPDDFNDITQNFRWEQGALERFKSPAYLGVGLTLILDPTKYQSTCCPNIRWKQVIKTGWYRRDIPDGSYTGPVYVDSPGGGVTQYIAGGGETYELSLICENPNFKPVVLAKWTWSWTFSLPVNFTVTTPF